MNWATHPTPKQFLDGVKRTLQRVKSCFTLDHVQQSPRQREVIKTFRHKGLEKFFKTGSKAGIQPAHAEKLKRQLAKLDAAAHSKDMNVPGWDLHPLKGRLAGHWSIGVNGNWRMTFTFDDGDAILVDYKDYHGGHANGSDAKPSPPRTDSAR